MFGQRTRQWRRAGKKVGRRPGWMRWREEPFRRQKGPGQIRWREEPQGRQEEPGGTQIPARIVAHGGADGWRSYGGGRADNSRGPTDCGGVGGGGAQGGDEELMSQGDREDPEGQSGAAGSSDRGEDPEGCSGAGATEGQGRAGGKEEPDRARGMEGRGAARGVESRGGAGGTMDRSGEEGARSHWADGPRRSPGQGILQPRHRWRLAEPRQSQRTDGGLRMSRGADRKQ